MQTITLFFVAQLSANIVQLIRTHDGEISRRDPSIVVAIKTMIQFSRHVMVDSQYKGIVF